MSGTSLDGIDVAACRFDNKKIELLGLYSEPWPNDIRERLLHFATSKEVEMDSLARTHFELGAIYSNTVKNSLSEFQIRASNVRTIGLHGQTIRHLPNGPNAATYQLGSGATLAALTEIDVVSDFRSADVALGGQGAPLVPMFDHYFLRSDSTNRLIVNIGGISNVTWIPKAVEENGVIAFDCGPGNMLMDQLAKKYFDRDFDENGNLARSGKIDESLLKEFLSHPYFSERPPKSTGRELFSEKFLNPIEKAIATKTLSTNDALATLTELTARSVAHSFSFFSSTKFSSSAPTELIVSGGGALNRFLMERIEKNLDKNIRVASSETFGIPVKAKEAIAFAFFAKAFVENISIHLPKTTGAIRKTTLGSLSKGK